MTISLTDIIIIGVNISLFRVIPFSKQILRLEENNVISMMIREEIDLLDAAKAVTANLDGEQDSDGLGLNSGVEYVAHVYVGSPLQSISVDEIETITHSDNPAFRQFRKKVIDSLEAILTQETSAYQRVKIKKDHLVSFLKLFLTA